MRLAIIITLAIMLSACAKTVYVPTPAPAVEIPALPATLAAEAPPLAPLIATDLHGHMLEGTASDRQYNDLRHRYNWLVSAYECLRLQKSGCLNDPDF